jgi:hypothetical protein
MHNDVSVISYSLEIKELANEILPKMSELHESIDANDPGAIDIVWKLDDKLAAIFRDNIRKPDAMNTIIADFKSDNDLLNVIGDQIVDINFVCVFRENVGKLFTEMVPLWFSLQCQKRLTY